jgi:hypothetical protein
MKIELEGTAAEVMGLIRVMAGGVVDNAAMLASGAVEVAEIVSEATSVPNARGRVAFAKMVSGWAVDFPRDGTAHWNDDEPSAADTTKGDKMRAVALGPRSGDVLQFVAQCGGLTRATADVLNAAGPTGQDLSRRIAVTLAQVASIVFPPLADLLEHFDPYGEKDND